MSENPDPEAVVHEQVRAYNDGDVDAFLAHYADDAVVTELESGEVVADGREELRETYGELFEANPDLHCEVVDRIVHDEFVVDRERLTNFGDGTAEAVGVYRVEDGTIRRLWLVG